MNVALYIATRLRFNKDQGHQKSSPGVAVGWIGVALAILIMLLSLFIVNGFKDQIKEKLLGFNAAVTIYAPEETDTPALTSGLRLTDSIATIIKGSAPNATPSLIIRQPAIFKTDNDFQGISLKGIGRKPYDWKFYEERLTQGRIPGVEDGDNVVVISSSTATRLGIKPGDRLTTHFLDDNTVRTRKLTVTGIFDTDFNDFDQSVAITSIAMLQRLNHVDSLTGTAIEISGIDIDNANPTASEINQQLISATFENPQNQMLFKVATINESCAQYLNWLNLLDTNVMVIIILMACVAGFTLISSLFIIILERVNTIGLLKAMGATNTQVRKIFIYMAQRLVVKGLIAGNALALLVSYIQLHFKIIPLDHKTYYLDHVPIEISWKLVLLVNVIALIASAFVLILPSHIIAGLSPSKTLRFE